MPLADGFQMPRWRLITILDVGSEIILMLIPAAMVYPLQMAFNLKFQVVLAFAFRLPYVDILLTYPPNAQTTVRN